MMQAQKKLSVSSYPWGVWVAICTILSVLAGCLCGFLAQKYIQNPFLGMFSLGFFFGFVLVGMTLMFIFAAKMTTDKENKAKQNKKKKEEKIGE
jgi:uncharacterized membrane protein